MSDRSPPDLEAFKRLEHEGWSTVAAGYHDAFSALTLQAVEPTLDAVGVEAGTRLLDLACGPGYIAGAAAARGATALGLDFSSTMVAEARRRFPRAEFREGDAEALPLDLADFDAVTMGFGMLHLAHPESALAQAHRVLRPGGRFAFTVWDAPERASTFGAVLKAVESGGRIDVGLPPGPPFFRFADLDESRHTLSDAGFAQVEVRILPLSWRVSTPEALLEKFLRGGVRTRALLMAQTGEELAAIRRALVELLGPYQVPGGYELTAPCVIATAVRP
jgi:SAM-dependent methyltransferase